MDIKELHFFKVKISGKKQIYCINLFVPVDLRDYKYEKPCAV